MVQERFQQVYHKEKPKVSITSSSSHQYLRHQYVWTSDNTACMSSDWYHTLLLYFSYSN